MSAFIGSVNGPHHNSPHEAAQVWVSREGGVEVGFFGRAHKAEHPTGDHVRDVVKGGLDPIAARNLAALLVRGADEVERMRTRERSEAGFVVDPLIPKDGSFGPPPPIDTIFINPRGRRYRVTSVDGNRCTLWYVEAGHNETAFWPLMVTDNGWKREGPGSE